MTVASSKGPGKRQCVCDRTETNKIINPQSKNTDKTVVRMCNTFLCTSLQIEVCAILIYGFNSYVFERRTPPTFTTDLSRLIVGFLLSLLSFLSNFFFPPGKYRQVYKTPMHAHRVSARTVFVPVDNSCCRPIRRQIHERSARCYRCGDHRNPVADLRDGIAPSFGNFRSIIYCIDNG